MLLKTEGNEYLHSRLETYIVQETDFREVRESAYHFLMNAADITELYSKILVKLH
jgi:hypothetical protein